MSLDEDVLRDVEAARTHLERLEDGVYDARAAFHQTIRRLHATGGSMREIAAALGMSHQRVHQIIGTEGIVEVEASAVTDVSPAVPLAGVAVAVTAGEDRCSFCGAPRRELDKLLAAPGPVFICDGCVGRASAVLRGGADERLRPVPVEEDTTCSFCGNTSAIGGVMAESAGGHPRICSLCVETCVRLVEAREPAKTMTRRNTKIRCSFCNVSQADTKKLVAGPGVYICEQCVAASRTVVQTGEAERGPRQVVLRRASPEEAHACRFCSKLPAHLGTIVKGGRARICDECLALCEEIVTSESD